MAKCNVCFRKCEISEGSTGFCLARTCRNGKIIAKNYGRITSMALDPIEKKPLAHYYPGSLILSVGSYGCNLRCPFCQNNEISWSDKAAAFEDKAEYISPEELAATALYYRAHGNTGVAFTYNEPLIGYEFVRDTARLVHENGMKNVLVTNGTASLEILDMLSPYIDAMNIDLKGFTEKYYDDLIKGSMDMVLDFIKQAAKTCHVELTTLIIPGENDTDDEMRDLSSWIASLETTAGPGTGKTIPLHVSRFFPRFHMTDRRATDISKVYHLAEIARENLRYVYTGNC